MIAPIAIKQKYISQTNKVCSFNARKNFQEITPKEALELDFNQTIKKLEELISKQTLQEILNGKTIASPSKNETNSDWLKQSKIIGINPRALGSYFDIVKYALTFPEDSIHLLPLFEQGFESSLYAPINFELSEEFLDENLVKMGFDSPQKQLKLVINILHALNKNVGMDFLQHTDRFSQEVFVNPDNFNWAKLNSDFTKELEYPDVIPDMISNEVKRKVVEFLKIYGDSYGKTINKFDLDHFYQKSSEERYEILFKNKNEEQKRRKDLTDFIRNSHFEVKPLDIHSPLKKIRFKKMHFSNNTSWAEFTNDEDDRIYGSLAMYKLYHLNLDGSVNIARPNQKTWDYIIQKNADFIEEYGFDFMRADMGYLSFGDETMDIHAKLKEKVQKDGVKHFASLGECFHFSTSDNSLIQRKNYDAILGNLQYKSVYDDNFISYLIYRNLNPNFKFSNTIITSDSDQKPNDIYYDNFQNTIRLFTGLFLNQPSYMSMGLELRNETSNGYKFYTKNFINDWGNKKYIWGDNVEFFNVLSSIRKIYTKIKETIQKQCHYWLKTTNSKFAAWFYYDDKTKKPSYLFTVNANNQNLNEVEIRNMYDTGVLNEGCETFALNEIYSNVPKKLSSNIVRKGKNIKLTNIISGECRIYKIISN